MSKYACIINLSAPEIQVVVLDDSQLNDTNISLSWNLGFQKKSDGNLASYFGKDIIKLDPNHPTEVRFRDLYAKFKGIKDTEVLECFFNAYFEEIFKQLPENEYSIYTITPYHWTPIHRQHLRKAIKQIKLEAPVAFLKHTKVTHQGMLSQILCLSAYYQRMLSDILTDSKKCHLFMIDFTESDFVVYQTLCCQLDNIAKIELTDVLQFTYLDTESKITSLQKILEQFEGDLPIVIGFSGRIVDNNIALSLIPLLQSRCNALFFEPQETATLLGATELVKQFQEKNTQKNIHLIYHFCFGVQFPDGKLFELAPANWAPSYHRKRAFQVTGDVEKFYVHLVCGLSMKKNSDVLRLATHQIIPPEDKRYNFRSPMEFLLSVTLNDYTHGTFGLHLPNSDNQKSIDFTVPVLMD